MRPEPFVRHTNLPTFHGKVPVTRYRKRSVKRLVNDLLFLHKSPIILSTPTNTFLLSCLTLTAASLPVHPPLTFNSFSKQCLESLRKTHKERSPCTSARSPARGLPISQLNSRHTSRASTRTQSISISDEILARLARSNGQCPFCVLCDARRGCWPGMHNHMNSSDL